MPNRTLIAWIGNTDIRASKEAGDVGLGPIANAVTNREFDEIHLLSDQKTADAQSYAGWLKRKSSLKPKVWPVKLSGPTRFGEIYEAAVATLRKLHDHDPTRVRTLHVSPGTPAMAAVWILLAKTKFPSELIESSIEEGVRTISVPFEIAADYMPPQDIEGDQEIRRLTQGLPPEAPEFSQIIYRCQAMKTLIAQARRVPGYDTILNCPLGNGLDLSELLGEVARHYLARAYEEADGNKSAACKLVGLPNYQTYTNWLKKYGVKS